MFGRVGAERTAVTGAYGGAAGDFSYKRARIHSRLHSGSQFTRDTAGGIRNRHTAAVCRAFRPRAQYPVRVARTALSHEHAIARICCQHLLLEPERALASFSFAPPQRAAAPPRHHPLSAVGEPLRVVHLVRPVLPDPTRRTRRRPRLPLTRPSTPGSSRCCWRETATPRPDTPSRRPLSQRRTLSV